MKICFAARRISQRNWFRAAFVTLMLASFGVSASAQAPADVPPAYGIAQRLQAEAASAAAMHDDKTEVLRASEAVSQYGKVVASREYGHTEYARLALHQKAFLEEHYLQDKSAAIQSLQTLRNQFPSDPTVRPEIERVGVALDDFNKTITPRSTPIHILRAGLYHVIDFMVALTGKQPWSYALAILLISLLVKLALTPLSNKQYHSMKEMQKLQPYVQELQAKHKNDKILLQQKTTELYKEHGVNMFGGCLPSLMQIPFWILMVQMISVYQYHFTNGTFLWIGSSLSHLFPTYIGLNLGQQDWPLLILYAGSMYLTQRMTITPSLDPQQAETQKMMAIMTPFMTTYFFANAHYPSAFVLYYLTFNIISTAQQKYYMRKRAGDSQPGSGGDGGSRRLPSLPGGSGGGQAIPLNGVTISSNGNGSLNGNGTHGNGSRRIPVGSLSDNASDGGKAHMNGTAPTAKGVIAPPKVHPRKKRR